MRIVCGLVSDMCSLSEAAEVHETSFNTEVSADTYHTYLFEMLDLCEWEALVTLRSHW